MSTELIDDELKELAALALRNAFWRDFSVLVNTYLMASEGLDVDLQTLQMGEMTSVYGRDTSEKPDTDMLNIWTQNGGHSFATSGHRTMLEALAFDKATEVHLRGVKVFKKIDGEWCVA